jgi:hypothetical protein
VSRSYPASEPGLWRMYCDSCDYVDPRRFASTPELSIFVELGWFIGMKTDRCPDCYTAKGAHEQPSPHMPAARL